MNYPIFRKLQRNGYNEFTCILNDTTVLSVRKDSSFTVGLSELQGEAVPNIIKNYSESNKNEFDQNLKEVLSAINIGITHGIVNRK